MPSPGSGIADVRIRPTKGELVADLRRLSEPSREIVRRLCAYYAREHGTRVEVTETSVTLQVAEPWHAVELAKTIRSSIFEGRRRKRAAARQRAAAAAGLRPKRKRTPDPSEPDQSGCVAANRRG